MLSSKLSADNVIINRRLKFMNREITASLIYMCLDLNIWVANLRADRMGKQGSACQSLVETVKCGSCSLGGVQLIISYGMLNRLRLTLVQKLHIPETVADAYISLIERYARFGPAGKEPQLSLGGTGIIPLRDTEDVHVLETAISGRAVVLITENFKDFVSKDTNIVSPKQHAIHFSPAHTLHIVHPYLMMSWIRAGYIPPPS